MAARKLPLEMTTPPCFRKVNPADFAVSCSACVSSTLPLSTVDDYAETMLAQQISQLPGVAQVLIFGAQKFAVRVQVDPDAAAARGIALDDVRTVVAKANSNTPVGTISGEPSRTPRSTRPTAMRSAADYRDVVVAYRNGAPISSARSPTSIDSVENDQVATWYNNERSIVLAIYRSRTPTRSDRRRDPRPVCRATGPSFRRR